MAIQAAIRRSRQTGTRRWIIPEHVQALPWPIFGYEPECSWPAWQTLTPNAFIPRYWETAAPAISAQFLRDLFDYIQDQDLGGYRWEESPFFAVGYWREAVAMPEPPPGFLTQLMELLRRAFVAVDRTGNILNYYNLAGQKVDDVDVPVGAGGPQGEKGDQGDPGPPGVAGRRGTLWFVGQGAPVQTIGVLERDMYLDTLSGAVWAFEGTRWVRK